MNKEDYNFDPMTGEKVIKDDYNFDPMTGEKIFGKRTQPRTKTCQSDFDVGGDKVVGGKAE